VLALTLPDDLYGDPTQRAHLRAAYEAGGVLEGVEVRWKKKGGEHIIVNLQEALTNACNHAQARNIDIDLIFGMHQVQLRIQDDGRGFDGAVGNGFGLISMRERAERIGGQLTMTSRPGQGTVVEVVVPYTESMTLQESCYEQETPNSRAHRR
jgi:signal transduction histidine kinase